jgi:hypothetical protein
MKRIRLFVLIAFIATNSCSYKKENRLGHVKINGRDVSELKLSEVRDTISLSLSQLMNKNSFIKLETKDENKFDNGKWSIGEKYIVGYCRRLGFFQFRSDGKFLRKLANFGKGPQEVYYPTWTISKDESHIYIYDLLKPKGFLCFSLDSGLFIKSIPIALEGQLKNIYMYDDSTLVCSPVTGTGDPAGSYYIFWQKISGEFIKGIPARNITRPTVPSESIMYRVGNYFHYRPVFGDTIFQVNGFEIEPCFIFDINNKIVDNENNIGHTEITILAETPGFILVQANTMASKEIIGEKTIGYSSKEKYYYIDKVRNRPYQINSFYNDFIGLKVRQLISLGFEYQTSDLKYVSIDAISLLRQIEKIKSDPEIRILNRESFLNLEKGITSNDNPVLLVGKLTKE